MDETRQVTRTASPGRGMDGRDSTSHTTGGGVESKAAFLAAGLPPGGPASQEWPADGANTPLAQALQQRFKAAAGSSGVNASATGDGSGAASGADAAGDADNTAAADGATGAARANPSANGETAGSDDARRELLVTLEFLGAVESPAADKARRMDLQVTRLSRRLSGNANTSPREELLALLQRWVELGPLPKSDAAEWQGRFARAVDAVLAQVH